MSNMAVCGRRWGAVSMAAVLLLLITSGADARGRKKGGAKKKKAPVVAPIEDDGLIQSFFDAHPQKFHPAVEHPEAHRIQILLTEVIRDRRGHRGYRTVRHGYRVDAEYFYPASAIKTLAAISALQTLRGMNRRRKKLPPVTLDTPLAIHRLFSDQPQVQAEDETHLANGRITLGHEIKKMSIVSDNGAFDRLYAFAGQDAINALASRSGLSHTRIFHRLSRRRTPEENRWAEAIELFPGEPPEVLPVPIRVNPTLLDPLPADLPGVEVGQAYVEGDTRVEGPMSFRWKNRMSLVDLQNMLIKIMRPEIPLPGKRFSLTRSHRAFLRETMRMRPGESTDPLLPEERYDPLRFKPVLGGLVRVRPLDDWQVWNKAGKAYGFRIENAYIEHPKKGRRHALFLTVAIYTNANATLNDNEYEYDTVADPFIHDLAEVAARTLWKLKPRP